MTDELTIIFVPADEGGYTAYIPEIPGAISEGESLEEAREMVIDAARELLAYRREEALKEKQAGSIVESIRLSA